MIRTASAKDCVLVRGSKCELDTLVIYDTNGKVVGEYVDN